MHPGASRSAAGEAGLLNEQAVWHFRRRFLRMTDEWSRAGGERCTRRPCAPQTSLDEKRLDICVWIESSQREG